MHLFNKFSKACNYFVKMKLQKIILFFNSTLKILGILKQNLLESSMNTCKSIKPARIGHCISFKFSTMFDDHYDNDIDDLTMLYVVQRRARAPAVRLHHLDSTEEL